MADIFKAQTKMGRGGGGQMVSVLALYFYNPSLNPVEFYNYKWVKVP